MKKTSRTIVFFGSGPVAATSLELLAQNFQIEAVVTKPKPEHHRGDFPVIDVAKRLSLPTFMVATKLELSKLIATRPFSSDLGVLIDFGIIVSQETIDYFELGILNSHFSVLPELRGADPISFAILSGQKMTGVSLMLLVEAMDEGPIVAYGEQPLSGDETTPTLTENLIHLSDALLRDIIPKYRENLKSAPQDITGRQVSYSRKLTKEDGIIDWTKPAVQIEREVRAFIEWPKSRATLAGKDVVLTKVRVMPSEASQGPPGRVAIEDKKLVITCGQGALSIETLKPAGKNEMTAQAFLAGHKHLLVS
jgi:methionyl-tRNA formyltransferase